ncbi:kinase-like domain-containing protein [Aspergillus pseudonomiae]|uniref:Kinase-like domain-containing protein n=1 Tax=Aspergillus pseudonomiae TaxID=1506151 RepID=A0A5N6IEG2_9EURO|nr:kinase-like domain-containing protein [Aspergillus pseudonomiae]KAB8264945.1 kinase-like domain-containing protein [Aspergillus pseudonomiae]KAE8407400.1 kinase-like domain-containing protein [Aspergillus pseudonomiae]
MIRSLTTQEARDTKPRHGPIDAEPARIDTEPYQSPDGQSSIRQFPFAHDPYIGLPVLGVGMTGIVYESGQDRVVKKARQLQLPDAGDAEYMNKINQQTLENEIEVLERLGSCEGIIPYFKISQYGIELARAQEDLESYLETHPECEDTLKVEWILSLIQTFSYIHSCKVFVDDIALRNILIIDNQLKVADFGQSILLPLDADITCTDEDGLNVQIEILHIGWIFYSSISWKVHKYYFFDAENPDLCWPASFPNVDDILCGRIIKKCWHGGYRSMDHLQHEALELLVSH